MTELSSEQMNFFNDNGYLILENLFSPEEVTALRSEADYLLSLIHI